MSKQSGPLDNIVDYRKHLSYTMTFTESSQGKLSKPKVIGTAIMMFIIPLGCFVSVVKSEELKESLENFKGVMAEVMMISVLLNETIFGPEREERLFEYLSKCHMTTRYGLAEEHTIIRNAGDSARKETFVYALLFIVNCPLMLLTKPVMAAIAGQSWKQLPLPWTLPEGDDVVLNAVLLLQIVGLLISHVVAIVMMSVLAITTQLNAQFDVVILGLRRIEDLAAQKATEYGLSHSDSMLSCIKESVAHHQELIRELLLVKPHLETEFFCQIMTISIIMACEVYPLIKKDLELSDAVRGIWFLIVQVLCTALICNKMEVMSNKNVEVCDALYNTCWYDCDIRYRRVVLNAITFSQNPIPIRGKGFLGMKACRETFYSAMVSTYNMLNMLRNAQ
uniref:Odorant receptor n=1 Tax=Adelphocoris lineolatus TaxID=236346 RepID=A0A2I4PH85_ADELI|nr:olfactory receptor 83 [Adelphocoris lineolatus]